jgi:hypothetical protein
MDAKGRQDLMQLSKAELVARVLAGVDERALRRYPPPPPVPFRILIYGESFQV